MTIIQDKLNQAEEAWNKNQEAKLIYEWVKTDNVDIQELKEILNHLFRLEEYENSKLFG